MCAQGMHLCICRALLGAVKTLREEADKRMEEKGEQPPKAPRNMSERARFVMLSIHADMLGNDAPSIKFPVCQRLCAANYRVESSCLLWCVCAGLLNCVCVLSSRRSSVSLPVQARGSYLLSPTWAQHWARYVGPACRH